MTSKIILSITIITHVKFDKDFVSITKKLNIKNRFQNFFLSLKRLQFLMVRCLHFVLSKGGPCQLVVYFRSSMESQTPFSAANHLLLEKVRGCCNRVKPLLYLNIYIYICIFLHTFIYCKIFIHLYIQNTLVTILGES